MVYLYNEGVNQDFEPLQEIHTIIDRIANDEKFIVGTINYIFCKNEYLLAMNQQYLRHDTYTDIITFDMSEVEKELSGDIYISTEQVKNNSDELETNYLEELLRVMIHGVLHLVGFNDHTEEEKRIMRKNEEKYMDINNTKSDR